VKRAKETDENGDAKHATAYIGHLYGGQTDFPFSVGHGGAGAVERACNYLVAEAEAEYFDARFTHRDIGDIRRERIDPFQIFIRREFCSPPSNDNLQPNRITKHALDPGMTIAS
jgi:hypothetical protein